MQSINKILEFFKDNSVINFITTYPRLRQYRKTFVRSTYIIKKHFSSLCPSIRKEIVTLLKSIESALIDKDLYKAKALLEILKKLQKRHCKQPFFKRSFISIVGTCLALVSALLIRQTWFELYEIPSGSMRPTFKEKDKLFVTKNQFGINKPFARGHFFFDDSQLQRGNLVTFTAENLDMHDTKTLYFNCIPGYKQVVKRLIGKPGDTLYFYGGMVYGFDANGKDFTHELKENIPPYIEYIPIIGFEHKVDTMEYSPSSQIHQTSVYYQMNRPIVLLDAISNEVVHNTPLVDKDYPTNYSTYELYGMKFFSQARLLSEEDLRNFYPEQERLFDQGRLYLELTHHPDEKKAKVCRDIFGRDRPCIGLYKSIIPLNTSKLKALYDSLYTARFDVDNGYLKHHESPPINKGAKVLNPYLFGINNGTYEFFEGRAYKVLTQGITKPLSSSHPLSKFSVSRLYTLFNLGVNCNARYLPTEKYQHWIPNRYAYFKDNDLYVMNKVLLKSDSKTLKEFIKREQEIYDKSPSYQKYPMFIPEAPPLNPDGTLNMKIVKQYGLTVPKGHVFLLGDNHAMSGDSREFGFVPFENLRGIPKLIFWGPGNRYGSLPQPSNDLYSFSRIIIWAIGGIGGITYFLIQRKRYRFPIDWKAFE